MSVAFRRESDDEHMEPKFELPIPPGPNLVTARGLALTQARVAELEAAVAAETEEEPLKKLRRELRYWRTRLATAQPTTAPEEGVGFGSRVHYRLNGAGKTIDIVGDDEADPAAGRIAFSAPLARALMEGDVGDRVDFGGKVEAIEIVDARPIPQEAG